MGDFLNSKSPFSPKIVIFRRFPGFLSSKSPKSWGFSCFLNVAFYQWVLLTVRTAIGTFMVRTELDLNFLGSTRNLRLEYGLSVPR
jgi:hypothetical protein